MVREKMILVAHQPQYLPWLGYFYKASLGDLFMILDHVQYSKNKVQNRNTIRGPNGPLILTVPVLIHRHFGDPICNILIDNTQPWARKHWKSIEQRYQRYPHFQDYASELEAVYTREWERLADLNVHLINLLMDWLGIQAPIRRSSELGFCNHRTELLIEMCEAVGADTYISGQGARAYLKPDLFRDAGIQLRFCKFRHPVYHQFEQPFIPELSALDVLMNLGPAAKDLIEEAKRISEIEE